MADGGSCASRLVGGQCPGRHVGSGLVGWQSLQSSSPGGLVGQRPCMAAGSGLAGQHGGSPMGRQAGSGSVGVENRLFFQCIMMWRSLPQARGSGC
jgi:hypothetical protein